MDNPMTPEREGYDRGVRDCLNLLAKWFYMTTIDARKCRDEMRALLQANEVKRLSNPVDDGAVERALAAFYASDSPAYEGDQKAAMRRALEAAEPHP